MEFDRMAPVAGRSYIKRLTVGAIMLPLLECITVQLLRQYMNGYALDKFSVLLLLFD